MSRAIRKTGHLTDDELVDRLYGVGAACADVEVHLLGCAICTDKLHVFEQRRAAGLESEPVSPSFLAAQRSKILERVEQGPLMAGLRLHWVPAALAGVLAAAVVLVPQMIHHPAPAAEKAAQQEVSEDPLFREVFSIEVAEEPRAASPIRGLFEAAVTDEQQQ